MNQIFDNFAQAATGDGITSYLFTQGVLGVAVIVLGIVVIYQQKKIDKKDEKLELLYEARILDNKTHAVDYREMAKDNQEVLQGNSQASLILGSKIEAVKGQRQ